MDIPKKLGARVRELRRSAGLTQAELAGRRGRGVELLSIGHIEGGGQNRTQKTVERPAKGLSGERATAYERAYLPQCVPPMAGNAGNRPCEARLALPLRSRWKVAIVTIP